MRKDPEKPHFDTFKFRRILISVSINNNTDVYVLKYNGEVEAVARLPALQKVNVGVQIVEMLAM